MGNAGCVSEWGGVVFVRERKKVKDGVYFCAGEYRGQKMDIWGGTGWMGWLVVEGRRKGKGRQFKKNIGTESAGGAKGVDRQKRRKTIVMNVSKREEQKKVKSG